MIRTFILAFVSLAAFGQTKNVPAGWAGTWELNVPKSTFGEVLIPGVPPFTIMSQTMTITPSAMDITLSGNTLVLIGGGSQSLHDGNRLKLDGTVTVAGPTSLSFRYIDDSTFDIISAINIPGHNLGQVSHFVFSSDGTTMTETKTQTERALVPDGTDKLSGAVLKTSKSVLVFTKTASR